MKYNQNIQICFACFSIYWYSSNILIFCYASLCVIGVPGHPHLQILAILRNMATGNIDISYCSNLPSLYENKNTRVAWVLSRMSHDVIRMLSPDEALLLREDFNAGITAVVKEDKQVIVTIRLIGIPFVIFY